MRYHIQCILINHGFNVKTVKRFDATSRPMPICLVIITKDIKASKIFELNNLFYLLVKIETFRCPELA